MDKKVNLLGAHMSIAGGIDQALYNGSKIGCSAIQIFVHSNRRWQFKNISNTEIEKFIEAKKITGITNIIVHASYLINLGSNSSETQKKSIETLVKELEICHKLNIKYLVIHPGSGQDNNQDCIKQIAYSINKIFDKNIGSTEILLENTAGQGKSVGYKFEQLAELLNLIENKKRIGICFDTCHAWAAGYDFSDQESYKNMWHNFNSILNIKNLKAMHLNDSKKNLGSRIDRHEEIGMGTIGIKAFKLIMNDKLLVNIPKILETPSKSLEDYLRNLNLLKSLINNK